ncbi:MAG: histone deacetylase [Deltaproteobacteria bacterium]|nr:MAG: histone deacetylase [Deltaproteobacteria bacterium]
MHGEVGKNGLKIVYSGGYYVDIGLHVFPTKKYRLTYEYLLREGFVRKQDFLNPDPASDEDILLFHTRDYLNKLHNNSLSPRDIACLEMPFSPELFRAARLGVGGTILAGRLARKDGIGIHLGGGFHHALPDHGEGFCVLNDIVIGLRRLQEEGEIVRGMVVDCDLHQGNGTAVGFAEDENVFTFSIHQERIYPFPKEESSLDIGLTDGIDDEGYLGYLRRSIPGIIEDFRPELILYVAGADPYRDDQLGGLSLSIGGLIERDKFVIGEAFSRGIPIVVVMGGGYAVRLEDTVLIHANTVKTAMDILS